MNGSEGRLIGSKPSIHYNSSRTRHILTLNNSIVNGRRDSLLSVDFIPSDNQINSRSIDGSNKYTIENCMEQSTIHISYIM